MCSPSLRERYVNFYTDFAFKKLFGTEMNMFLLISFLNSLFAGKETLPLPSRLREGTCSSPGDSRRREVNNWLVRNNSQFIFHN